MIAKLTSVPLSGTAVTAAELNLGGVYVDSVFVKNAGSQTLTNVTVQLAAESGDTAVTLGSAVASVTAGTTTRIDVGHWVEVLKVIATAASATTADVKVTGGSP